MSEPGQPSALPIGLPPEQFAAAFPFHLALDRKLSLVQAGSTLRRICPDVQAGADLDQIFRSIRPEGRMTLEWVLQHRLRFFLLEHLTTKLQLRGEFIILPEQDTLLFLGSPWFTDSSEIATLGLGFEDFAIHDPVVDMLQVFQASKMALADAKKLADKLTRQRTELRAANQRLLQQEAETRKLALIAARTDNAVVLTDALGVTEWVNEGFVRLTGYTFDEIRGRKPGSLLQGPDTDPNTVRYIREQLAKGEGFSVELLNYGKCGRKYWLAIEVQPIRDEVGRITNFMAIEADITQRKLADRRLAVQYSVSRTLAECNTVAEALPRILQAVCDHLNWQAGEIWNLDETAQALRGVATWHDPRWDAPAFIADSLTRQFPVGVGLPGRVWMSGEPSWIRDVVIDPNFPRAALAARENLHGAFGFPIRAGGEFWGVMEFFSRNIEEPDEALLRMFGAVGEQIGQFIVRKQAEAALRQTNTLQRAILESANYSVISTTPDGTIVTFNRAAEQMLGYRAEEVAGRATPALFHDAGEVAARAGELTRELGREIEAGFEAFVTRARLGEPDEREWTYIRKDGTRFPVRLSVTALFDEQSRVTGFLGIASDITESKQAAEELLRAKEAAESASRAKSEFLAMMSHEIRTPMNAIIGMTNLLQDTPLSEQQREFVQTVGTSGEALLEIINDILDFSKIEAGQLRLEMAILRPARLIEGVMDLLATRAQARGLTLEARVAPDVPEALRSDDGRLRQVLVNLVGNGLKFTEHGGVRVEVRCLRESAARAQLRFEVRDSGPGIKPEDQERLFQPFIQLAGTTARRQGGTGLGLAISRRIVELLGGTIGVESKPGRGSVFWFEIEAEIAQPEPALEDRAEMTKDRAAGDTGFFPSAGSQLHVDRPLRILVAEDHDTNRRLAALMLEKLGQRADFAGNGLEAVDAWERFAYDVILMDCQMPEMDGFAATREIRCREAALPASARPPVHIIALTANALAGDRERCLAAGMNGYVSKPVRLEALRAALGRATPGVGMEANGESLKAALARPQSKIAELRREFGDEAAAELLASFLKDTPPRLKELRQLAGTDDRQVLARSAHSLAGSCGIFELEFMRTLALTLEEMARQSGAQDFEPLVEELERNFLAALPDLQRLQRATQTGQQP